MDYIIFTAWNIMLLIAAVIVYTGCRRSYSIYFFERDIKKVVFLGNEGAVATPIVLSVLLIILHHTLKLSDDNDMKEKVTKQKRPKLRTTSISYQLMEKTPTKLEDISESAVPDSKFFHYHETLIVICIVAHFENFLNS
ncbi:unnamed protein product [Cercopithifilaria johnstoni]|uniref:Uncharacterized protein n=1 Tax=Cercopithifilaria johnstoni TaxID=2874296 RepID=A0A8J2PSS2_9BILA|nr:unnamed protein product [Cercopithifilaria johnstoni]